MGFPGVKQYLKYPFGYNSTQIYPSEKTVYCENKLMKGKEN